ncbi:MAG: thrombospondin type 3 repeat-containing protein [Verrucomicrobiales bacterium]
MINLLATSEKALAAPPSSCWSGKMPGRAIRRRSGGCYPGMLDQIETSEDLETWQALGSPIYGVGYADSPRILMKEAPEPLEGGGGNEPPAEPDSALDYAGFYTFVITPISDAPSPSAMLGWIGAGNQSYQVLLSGDYSAALGRLSTLDVETASEYWTLMFFGGSGLLWQSDLGNYTAAALPAGEQATYDRFAGADAQGAIAAYLAAGGNGAGSAPPPIATGGGGQRFWRVVRRRVDSDGDGWSDYDEIQAGTSPFLQDSDGDGIIDPEDDDDNDGVPNKDDYNLRLERQFVGLEYEVPPGSGGGSSTATYPDYPTFSSPAGGTYGTVWNTDFQIESINEEKELGSAEQPDTIRGIAESYTWDQVWETVWTESQSLPEVAAGAFIAYGQAFLGEDQNGYDILLEADYYRFRLRLAADRPLDEAKEFHFLQEYFAAMTGPPTYESVSVELPANATETPDGQELDVRVTIPENERSQKTLMLATLTADTNRDGKIDGSDEVGKDKFTNESGAVYVVNYDHDEERGGQMEDTLKWKLSSDGKNENEVTAYRLKPDGEEWSIDPAKEDPADLTPLLVKVPALPESVSAFFKVKDGSPDDAKAFHLYIARFDQAGEVTEYIPIWGGFDIAGSAPQNVAIGTEVDITRWVNECGGLRRHPGDAGQRALHVLPGGDDLQGNAHSRRGWLRALRREF